MTPALSDPRQLARNLVQLARPQNVLYSGFLAVLAAAASGAQWWQAAICYLVMLSVYALAASFNNIQDVEIDRVNARRDNPLVVDASLGRYIKWFVTIHGLVLVAAQLWLSQPASLLICLVFLALLTAYSHPGVSLQSRGFLATICLALCYGTLPLLLGAVQGMALEPAIIWLGLLQILLLAPLLLAKDYKDVAGDRRFGKRTPLVRYGERGVWAAAAVCSGTYVGILVWYLDSLSISTAAAVLSLIYLSLVAYIHFRRGRQSPLITRIAQVVMLALSWQFLQ